MPFGLPELAAAVRRFLDDNLPDRNPRQLIVYLDGGNDNPARVTVPAKPCRPKEENEPREEENNGHRRRTALPDCLLDILATLREHHPRPLTRTRLLEEMAKKGRTYAESTVCRYLEILMKDETIDNPPKARPPGYRLTEAETTSGE